MEVAKVLRRMTLGGSIGDSQAAAAHDRLMNLPVVLFPYTMVGRRVWELRNTVAVHDACFVALAEGLDAELATLDGNLARAPGPRCRFLAPPV
jgi:predicted nucleic acid-binding protein